jgi:hypothetical protein
MITQLPVTIAADIEHFTGRTWLVPTLLERFEKSDERMFILTGGPGSGKSAVAARLVQIACGDAPAGPYSHLAGTGLAYYHFCQAQYNAVVDLIGFVKSLSMALADRYPAFAQALTHIDQRHSGINIRQTVGQATGSEITAVKIERLEVGGLSARKAFSHVVAEPLQKLVQSSDSCTILILADALDEALPFDPDDNIVSLLADVSDDPRDLPRQVRILMAGRPDPCVVDLIRKPALDLVDDAPDSAHDVQDYAERRLTPVLAEPAVRRDLAQRISTADAGDFLYARHVLDDFVRHPADPAELTLPEGLDGVYGTFLRREVGRRGGTWRTYRPLLGVLVMARGSGLTRQQLAGIMKKRISKIEELLEPGMQCLTGAFLDGPFRIYHQSFREFLLESQVHRLEPDEVRDDLARYFWKQYVAFRHRGASLDDYALAHLPVHLAEAGRTEDVRRLLLDYRWLQTKLDRLGVNTLLADFALSQPADDDPTRKLHCVLEQGAYILAKAPDQLAPQLLGRLLDDGDRCIQALLAQAGRQCRRPCLLPRAASLRQGSALLRTLAGHTSKVTAVAVTPDGSRAVSASTDNTLKVWDLASGVCLATFHAHGFLSSCVVTPNGRTVVAAGALGRVHFLRWEE